MYSKYIYLASLLRLAWKAKASPLAMSCLAAVEAMAFRPRPQLKVPRELPDDAGVAPCAER